MTDTKIAPVIGVAPTKPKAVQKRASGPINVANQILFRPLDTNKMPKIVSIDQAKKLSAGDVLAAIVLLPFMLTGCASASTVKNAQDLSASEQGAVDNLLVDIYKKSPKLNVVAHYSTTIYMDPDTKAKLSKPITTTSVGITNSYLDASYPEWKADLTDSLNNMSVSWNENGKRRTLEIIEYSIEDKIGGAGGSVYTTYDMVTIYPKKVRITDK